MPKKEDSPQEKQFRRAKIQTLIRNNILNRLKEVTRDIKVETNLAGGAIDPMGGIVAGIDDLCIVWRPSA